MIIACLCAVFNEYSVYIAISGKKWNNGRVLPYQVFNTLINPFFANLE